MRITLGSDKDGNSLGVCPFVYFYFFLLLIFRRFLLTQILPMGCHKSILE